MQLLIVGAIVVAVVAVVFAVQNAAPVAVTFLAWRFDSSLALVLVLAMACGILLTALWSAPAALRIRWQLAQQRRRIAQLEAQVAELRAQPRPVEAVSGDRAGPV